jgi:lipid-A-disaccharide synthase
METYPVRKDADMRLFLSAGEPSGDLHGANLARSLRGLEPGIELDGFGGRRMAAAGCSLLYPLCDHAVIGLVRAVAGLRHFAQILERADRHFRRHRPDAVVLIDFPGFHWWLARRAREQGIPVFYFVPPQLWAWGGWRARKMRTLVDHVLCALPFEQPWYRRRHIPVTYVGHPYFDALSRQHLDAAFLAEQRARPGTVIALLPGSRRHELEDNGASLLRTAALVHARRPDTRFLVACLEPRHRDRIEAMRAGFRVPVEVHAGRTPEIIHLAHSCVAVSGSVGLELLFAGKPSLVLYRINWFGTLLAALFKGCRYISLVNLLAGRELYPEFLARKCPAEEMAGRLLHWLDDRPAYEALCGELAALRERVAVPGACDRAAGAILGRTPRDPAHTRAA